MFVVATAIQLKMRHRRGEEVRPVNLEKVGGNTNHTHTHTHAPNAASYNFLFFILLDLKE